MKAIMSRLTLIGILLFATVGCDQATKHIARETLQGRESFSYLGDMIRFQHAENPGAFLSFGASLSQPARFGIFTALVIAFLIWAAFKIVRDRATMNLAATLGWTLVLAGGIGNVIDRLAKSTVTDFVMVGVGPIRTGIFNVADMAIMGGIALLLILGREGSKPPPMEKAKP